MDHSEINNNITDREKQVLGLVACEYNTVEISYMLRISARTVETHRKNILRKINSKSLVGLTKHAIKLGLVSDFVFMPSNVRNDRKESRKSKV